MGRGDRGGGHVQEGEECREQRKPVVAGISLRTVSRRSSAAKASRRSAASMSSRRSAGRSQTAAAMARQSPAAAATNGHASGRHRASRRP